MPDKNDNTGKTVRDFCIFPTDGIPEDILNMPFSRLTKDEDPFFCHIGLVLGGIEDVFAGILSDKEIPVVNITMSINARDKYKDELEQVYGYHYGVGKHRIDLPVFEKNGEVLTKDSCTLNKTVFKFIYTFTCGEERIPVMRDGMHIGTKTRNLTQTREGYFSIKDCIKADINRRQHNKEIEEQTMHCEMDMEK